MTNEEKAIKACRTYARLNIEIHQLTQAIAEHLNECPGVFPEPARPASATLDDFLNCTAAEPHLKGLYRGHLVDGDYYAHPGIRFFSDKEIRARLATECPHCLAAHDAIQRRKAARRSLGAAKRTITIIGRTKEPA